MQIEKCPVCVQESVTLADSKREQPQPQQCRGRRRNAHRVFLPQGSGSYIMRHKKLKGSRKKAKRKKWWKNGGGEETKNAEKFDKHK